MASVAMLYPEDFLRKLRARHRCDLLVSLFKWSDRRGIGPKGVDKRPASAPVYSVHQNHSKKHRNTLFAFLGVLATIQSVFVVRINREVGLKIVDKTYPSPMYLEFTDHLAYSPRTNG
jgi:hypothetical protein